MIKIGVSSSFMYPDIKRATFGPKTLCFIERDMARYLTRPNVLPILIPDVEGGALDAYIDEIDGLVLQGGSDVAPESYKEAPIENGRWPGDKYRDEYELKLTERVFKQKKPILGICRGMQVLNVFFGGTLHQDLKTELPHSITHRDAELYDSVLHSVKLTGKTLKSVYRAGDAIFVNSVHHQGVKKLGNDLLIEARSVEDEIIEAFAYEPGLHDPSRFVLGVQWHPEFSHTQNGKLTDPNPIYDYFLEKIRLSKGKL